MDEVTAGKGVDEVVRKRDIVRHCRNRLPDEAVEWLDAAMGIAADGRLLSRRFWARAVMKDTWITPTISCPGSQHC